ncbi:MAG: AraC family transcriptional regulator, partial [Marivirga sp.]|nr:AraC family transcriptional regulator [Marivirga sp.]
NEQFGVSELADEMNMSRSNLLRKVKKLTNLSVSQLISQVRLKRGMVLLQKGSLNVSEISHQVGFSSTSYFIKCFREYYGYPPGEVGKREETEIIPSSAGSLPDDHPRRKSNYVVLLSAGLISALVVGSLFYYLRSSTKTPSLEKSIAVLPFKNESNDSTNVYLINGLMESTLNNLQKIGDLKVISRTSTEKYRTTVRSIPEIANELNVNYFVEGSGQKIGDRILLNIQLIEGPSDKHLWSKQYRRDVRDIFELQQEIARNIAEEVQAVITADEEKRIKKTPTDDLVAYDLFLKGKDLFYESTSKSLQESIPYFKRAIEQDNEFALAYANVVMVYYYLDMFHVEKKYTTEINSFADKAMLFDPKSGESLIAKALSYAHKKEFGEAVPYLEKALEVSPNSGIVIHFLTEFYSLYVPNLAKYLEYAHKGVKLDVASNDSTTLSFKYFHLSNAYMQAGFVDEAIRYSEKSIAYDPENPFSGYVGILFQYAKHRDLQLTKELLIKEFDKNPTRADIVKEIGRVCYTMRDYKSAYTYYKKFIELREQQHLEIFKEENLAIGIVFAKTGLTEKSEGIVKSFKDYADNDRSIYKHFLLTAYYSYLGDAQKAIDHLKLFSKEDNYIYWVLLLRDDPVVDSIKDLPEFKKTMNEIETKFWNNHKKIKETDS